MSFVFFLWRWRGLAEVASSSPSLLNVKHSARWGIMGLLVFVSDVFESHWEAILSKLGQLGETLTQVVSPPFVRPCYALRVECLLVFGRNASARHTVPCIITAYQG